MGTAALSSTNRQWHIGFCNGGIERACDAIFDIAVHDTRGPHRDGEPIKQLPTVGLLPRPRHELIDGHLLLLKRSHPCKIYRLQALRQRRRRGPAAPFQARDDHMLAALPVRWVISLAII